MQSAQSDFLPVVELAKLTPFKPKGIYNQHSSGTGPLVPILTKVGGRLGAWRADYELWRDSQRRLKPVIEPDRATA
jgi:hypothetical protein